MSIFSDLKPHSKWNRNAVDLSHTTTQSAKVGQVNICQVLHTVPGAYYKVKPAGIVRTAPMQKANFTEIKVNMETFFVPYTQLWSEFNRFYFGRGETNRNLDGTQSVDLSSSTPVFNWLDVAQHLQLYCCMFYWLDLMSKLVASVAQSLDPRDANYDTIRDFCLKIITSCNVTLLSYFTLDGTYYSSVASQLESNIANWFDVHGRFCGYDMVRNFDLAGYGNLLPEIRRFEQNLSKALVLNPDFVSQYDPDESYIVNFTNLFRFNADDPVYLAFFEDQGDIPTSLVNGDILSLDSPMEYYFEQTDFILYTEYKSRFNYKPNAFVLQGFYKIWSDFYRNSQYDTEDYSLLFDIAQNNLNNVTLSTTRVLLLLKPFYHLYKRDIFTGGYPTAQFGSVAVAGAVTNGEYELTQYKTGPVGSSAPTSGVHAGMIYSQNAMGLQGVSGSQVGHVVFQKNNDTAISALAIRQVMAMQRYKESILRAGNREKDLLDATFGVTSKYIQDAYVDFIDSCDGVINVNPVAATAENESSKLGELGSYAVGSVVGDEFEYQASDFGMLITVMYISPEVKYNSYGFDPMNTKTEQFDFYSGFFQNLGLAPVTNLPFNNMMAYRTVDNVETSRVLGYSARYWEYKTALSKVHGEFYSSTPYEAFLYSTPDHQRLHDYFQPFILNDVVLSSLYGSKADYVSPRDVNNFVENTLAALYISPADLDSLFYSAADEYQLSDHFDFEISFRNKAIVPMSVIGLPNSNL